MHSLWVTDSIRLSVCLSVWFPACYSHNYHSAVVVGCFSLVNWFVPLFWRSCRHLDVPNNDECTNVWRWYLDCLCQSSAIFLHVHICKNWKKTRLKFNQTDKNPTKTFLTHCTGSFSLVPLSANNFSRALLAAKHLLCRYFVRKKKVLGEKPVEPGDLLTLKH